MIENTEKITAHRFGVLSLIGRANVGKSTLLNCLIGKPLSAVSTKAQTTRKNFRGIMTTKDYQAIFIDTPGVHQPKNKLQKRMLNQIYFSLEEVDLILYLVEAPKKNLELHPLDSKIMQAIPAEKCILILNKIDLLKDAEILSAIRFWSNTLAAKEIVPLSALKNRNLSKLKSIIGNYLPQEKAHFPKDLLTDSSLPEIFAEFVREQAFRVLGQELPYSLTTVTEKIQKQEELIKIFVCIYIAKNSHKKIVIGKGGEMLKKIGTRARVKLEKFTEKKVFLDLHVKQLQDWQNKESFLDEWFSLKN